MSKSRLKKVMSVQTTTYYTQLMDDYIFNVYEELAESNPELYSYQYSNGNTYITKGDAKSYPCVIAHTDTVHDIHDEFEVFSTNDIMFAMDTKNGYQVGVGGDDKVGVYVALEMLRKVDVIKVAFFRDEEHGCLGSREANMDWFEDVEFVLQCDRQKYKDFVRTIYGQKLYDKDFYKAIRKTLNSYGKVETDDGGLTDVYQLNKNGLSVCSANISCGYYRPHSDEEVIIVSQVLKTRDFVMDLIKILAGKIWVNKLSNVGQSDYWNQRSKDDWGGWSEQDYIFDEEDIYKSTFLDDEDEDEDESFYSKIAQRHGLTLQEARQFDDAASIAHLELENFCSECGSDEIIYDKTEDADWCFSCNAYTNQYSNIEKA